MIAYLDTSAVVPILVEEPTTTTCRRIWLDADRLVTTRLTYVEVGAALAMAERRQRVTAREHDRAWTNFLELWTAIDVVDVSEEITTSAATLTRPYSLRGYDAVHCATAIAVNDQELVAAAGDRQLLDAWREQGLAVFDTVS